MKKPDPFSFVLEELAPIRPVITQAFGFRYVYLDDRLLCALRNSDKKPGTNGIWLFTTLEHLESLSQEFPELPRRCLWRSKPNAWIVLPTRLEHFEEYAYKACELLTNHDRRIGRTSRRQSSRGSQIDRGLNNWSRDLATLR